MPLPTAPGAKPSVPADEEVGGLPSIKPTSVNPPKSNSGLPTGQPRSVSAPPVRRRVQPSPPPSATPKPPTQEPQEEGWVVDPRTGIRHRVFPPSQYSGAGNEGVRASDFRGAAKYATPVLQIPDFDADDLDKEANDFLAHLRVVDTPEEKQARREERSARMAQRHQ